MAAVVVEVEDIAAVQEFLLTKAGFRLCTVFPADSPREVELELSAGGLRVRLRRVSRSDSGPPAPMVVVELPRDAARGLLARADGRVKPAIVMHALSVDAETAWRRLEEGQGVVRRVVPTAPPPVVE